MRKMLVLGLACLVSVPSFAQTPAPDAAPAPADKPAKEKRICRQEEKTGSYIPARTCHSQAEWEQIDAANRRATEAFGSRNRMGHRTGAGG